MDDINGNVPDPMQPLFKCWLSDWFMATREDTKSYHCTTLGHSTQCDYCRAKEDHPTVTFIFTPKGDAWE